jgi:hypothetical protein
MADPGLHMVPLEIGAQSGTQVVCGHRLADGADVVAFAFDREQHSAFDGARLNALALPFELASGQRTLLKNAAQEPDGSHCRNLLAASDDSRGEGHGLAVSRDFV